MIDYKTQDIINILCFELAKKSRDTCTNFNISAKEDQKH